MKEVAEEKGKLIKQQLEFYQPDVIIACGLGELFDLLRGIIDSQGEAVIKLGKRKFQEVRLSGRPVYLVESYHPAQRGNTYDAFAEVVGSFRQVAKNIV